MVKGRRFKFKSAVSGVAAAALVASMVPAAALAATYQPPTEPTDRDDVNYVTSAVHAAAEMDAQYLGLDNTTYRSNSFSVKNLTQAVQNNRLGVFGSALNENPDTLLKNYFYNFYAAENDLEKAEYVPQEFPSGGPMSAGGAESVYWRPDILVGISASTANGYATRIANLPENLDEDQTNNYDPYLVGISHNSYTKTLLTLDQIATYADEITSTSTKTTRYQYTASQMTASDCVAAYEDVVLDTQYYILSQIAQGKAERQTYANISSIDTTNNTITLAMNDVTSYSSSDRLEAAVQNCADNIAANLSECKNGSSWVVPASVFLANMPDVAIAGGGMNSSDKSAQLKTVLESAGMTEEQWSNLRVFTATDGFMSTDGQGNNKTGSEPNGPEYGLYVPELLGYMYNDVIDQMDLVGYYFRNLYHVNADDVQSTVNEACANLTTADGLSIDADYLSSLATKFAEGEEYYAANKDTLVSEYATLISLADAKTSLLTTLTDENVVPTQSTYMLESDGEGGYNNIYPTVELVNADGSHTALAETSAVNTRYYDSEGNRVFKINEPGTYTVRVMGIQAGSDGSSTGYAGEAEVQITVNAGLSVSYEAAEKGMKETVTASLGTTETVNYRFCYSNDGETWVQAAKNTTGVANITANATNAARQWKVYAVTSDGTTYETSFSVIMKDPTVSVVVTPATTYGGKATVSVSAADFGTYGPAKYKYYYLSGTSGQGPQAKEIWTQVAYNRTYDTTNIQQITANGTNSKRTYKVVATFRDGRTAEAKFTVSYQK